MNVNNLKKKTVINLIQDVATPHNNILIEKCFANNVKLNLWYSLTNDKNKYNWNEDLANKYYKSKIYGKKINISFLIYCLWNSDEKYIIVGWANINTLLLHVLFFLLRRPFNHWTDMPRHIPNKSISKAKILRSCAYMMLRNSKTKIFCVGKKTLKYFKKNRFSEKNLINLPILVEINDKILNQKKDLTILKKKFCNNKKKYLITSGSRLVYDKGFDLLINSVDKLPLEFKKKIKIIIVGNGPEELSLKNLIKSLNLKSIVKIKTWMKFKDFKKLIAASDIFIQPSRFDAYGSAILGMSLGVAVISSTNSGAGIDRIKNRKNGLLYDAKNIEALKNNIELLLNDEKLRKKIAEAGKRTASYWPPQKGVKILLEKTI